MNSFRERLLIAVGPGQFAGVALPDWWNILRDNRFAVDSPYLGRAAMITLCGLANSAVGAYETSAFGPDVEKTSVESPIFILGHWRSGTTHLHNLFTVDQRFAYPNLYQVVFPHTFLSTEAIASRILGLMIPGRRLGDGVRQSIAMAAEDEFALCVMTGLSPYMSSSFPGREDYYSRYLTFRQVSDNDIAAWKAALKLFLQKLTWKYRRPVILKSPTHTGRIRLLLELFPDARFIHIHRDPYAVFLSNRKRHDVATQYSRLQRWTSTADEMFLQRYCEMYDQFFAERPLIPADRFHEMAFEDLERDPLGQMREIYAKLDLPGFRDVETPLREHVASLADYRKNEYPAIPADLKSRIRTAWQRSFEEWGYALA
jgi:hypothetical protein